MRLRPANDISTVQCVLRLLCFNLSISITSYTQAKHQFSSVYSLLLLLLLLLLSSLALSETWWYNDVRCLSDCNFDTMHFAAAWTNSFRVFFVVVVIVVLLCAVAAVAAQTFPLRFCDRVHENIEFMTQMCHFIENTIYRIRGASECAVFFFFFDLFFRPNINEIPTHYFLASVWPTREWINQQERKRETEKIKPECRLTDSS